jgi:hypothetical protein
VGRNQWPARRRRAAGNVKLGRVSTRNRETGRAGLFGSRERRVGTSWRGKRELEGL